MAAESSGEWLSKALSELSRTAATGIELDGDIISGLVSYCEMASPMDAKEYLDNIIGEDAGRSVIEEYMKRRGHAANPHQASSSSSSFHTYVKPHSDEAFTKKQPQPQATTTKEKSESVSNKAVGGGSKKKKPGRVVSMAEAAKGSIVFRKGEPCPCQARRHRLVGNCLSCGRIVCEQEGEGPCNFCGALVLKEGSSYAGLDEGGGVSVVSDADAAAEAFAKRLVEYDRNSAARTTVIDDQSDYFELEANAWLSMEEKELLMKKRQEVEEAEKAKRGKVVVTFDLVGRKVLLNEDEAVEELQNRILLQPSDQTPRIKPNPSLKLQPIFIDPGPRKAVKDPSGGGLYLAITGRVQHDIHNPVEADAV
ncbi:hypothetical protein M569_04788 [Genlisea aurea]|uniref:Uncharacterized protein n=1 Tax=Genlisea aurea TaxID=192259 RepID=S8CY90_9LAMI|nr:hypothetical protein M569_04788 [Genlisea aurea]